MPVEVLMPQLGESVHEGTVARWLKRVGDRVERFEPLLEVITDKVDTVVTATHSGTLREILVPEGETVKVGTVVAILDEVEEAPSTETAARTEAVPPVSPVVARIAAEHGVDLSQVEGTGQGGRITKRDVLAYVERRREETVPSSSAEETVPFVSPVVARLAAEHKIDLREVRGTGRGGRITKKDILAYLAQREGRAASPPPAEVSARETGDREVPITPMRRAIAEHMVRSLHTAAHVTTVMEVDMSRVVAHREAHKEVFRQREGFSLTYTPYIVQAVAQALRVHPMLNAVFTGDKIILKGRINIGVAVALDDGLIVPVVKDADEKSLLHLAREINELATRAREKRLVPDEVQEGTFTITNHGVSGSLFATPIIHQPQAAVLGVGAIHKRVVVTEEDALVIRPMCYLSLSFDHRILDGVQADRFLSAVKIHLETGDFTL